jgi:hypothetical protein
MHVLRLAAQGRELMQTGRLTLPVPEPERALILAVRRGDLPFADVVELVEQAERDLVAACDESPLPEQPDTAAVEAWMMDAYERTWSNAR